MNLRCERRVPKLIWRAARAIDLRLGHCDTRLGFLHVGPRSDRRGVIGQRQRAFALDELFERVAQGECCV